MKKSWMTLLLVPVPFLIGFAMSKMMMWDFFSRGMPLLPMGLIFVVFWAWVGSVLARLEMKKVYSFLLGNSLNIISFLLLIWFFLLEPGPITNVWVGRLNIFAQYYILPMVNLASQTFRIFTNHLHGTIIMFFSNFLLTLVFSVGFFYRVRKEEY